MSCPMWNSASRAIPMPPSVRSFADSPSLARAIGGAETAPVPCPLRNGPSPDGPKEGPANALVTDEIVGTLRRAVPRKIIRRCDDRHATGPELAQAQAGFSQRSDADGDIGALLKQIDHGVGENNIQGDSRMLLKKGRHQRHHMEQSERDIAVDPEVSPR